MYNKLYLLCTFTLIFQITTAESDFNDPSEIPDQGGQTPYITSRVGRQVTRNVIVTKRGSDNSITNRIYRMVADPLVRIIKIPKIKSVLRNIGTCVVNGAMDIFSYYLPPAFMPLIASVAGFYIPFEPVVMLKERMPVNTYRRAFKTAMSSFLNIFDQFKVEDEYDPYMTQRFNRRFMDDDPKKKKVN